MNATSIQISIHLIATLVSGFILAAPSPERPVGWRSDGTGCYTGVVPPTQWDEKTNVAWKIKLPGRSQGSPILVDDRLFVACDPAELICVNPADGEILWRRSNTPQDLDGADKAKEIEGMYAQLRKERHSLEREHGKAKDDKGKQKEIRQQLEAVDKKRRALMKTSPFPPSYADGETSNSAATPICDGTHVYTVFGNGIVCAYSLAGDRRWAKFMSADSHLRPRQLAWLADGKLIFHLNDLFAVKAATGEIEWRHTSHCTPRLADDYPRRRHSGGDQPGRRRGPRR